MKCLEKYFQIIILDVKFPLLIHRSRQSCDFIFSRTHFCYEVILHVTGHLSLVLYLPYTYIEFKITLVQLTFSDIRITAGSIVVRSLWVFVRVKSYNKLPSTHHDLKVINRRLILIGRILAIH